MFKTRGGVKGRLNNVKKPALLANVGFPYSSPSFSVLFDLAQVCLQHDSVNDTTSDMGDSPAF